MPLNTRLRSFLCAILTFLCSSVYAAPLLNGVAVHQELGNEQFIGALFSEVLSNDPETLLSSNLPMRMELKVIAPDGIPLRRFSRMWIEGMAINNNNNLLTAQADNMVKFDSLFKGKLAQNDHIVFAVTPGTGVDITVNRVLLGNIPDANFFSMLLRTWIGRVPLSSSYREGLLKVGDVPANLRTRYESITFSSARAAEISTWSKPSVAPEQIASAPTREPAPAREAAQAPARNQPPAPAAASKIELPTLERPTTAGSSTPAAAERENRPTKPAEPASRPAEPVSRPTQMTTVASIADEEEDAQPALTAQSLLARQFYVSDMLRKIRSNVTYPRAALQRKQEGSMRIAITVNRKGEVINMEWLEESKYDRLNRAAWEAVLAAAPFPPMPDALPGQRFEFSAPISFEMTN